MSEVTFVRTRTYYQPYDDWYRLAELSGYPICYVDEMDAYDPSKVWIISPLNGEWKHGWPGARSKLVFAQLEWHTDYSRVELPPGVSECWSADKFHADLIGARFVPIGSHECLNLHPELDASKEYDIALMGYYDVWRRKRIKDDLEAQGFKIAPNGWGDTRDDLLRKSRVMVHVHQWDNMPTVAPLRWCIAAAYKLPIISERVSNRAPFQNLHFAAYDYDELVSHVGLLLQPQAQTWLEGYGCNLHRFLCHEMTFRSAVEAAL